MTLPILITTRCFMHVLNMYKSIFFFVYDKVAITDLEF